MIKYRLFDKINLNGIAVAGVLSLSAAFMTVPSVYVYADTEPTQLQATDANSSERSSEKESEKDDPAAGDIGDTLSYNIEKTKKQSVDENNESIRQDLDIDLSSRPYPDTDKIIKSDSYYNLGALTNYDQYVNMSFDVAENDVTRIQVIYSGESPEFAFFNPEKQIYAGTNKTYENGFCIVKKTRDDFMSIGQADYSMDVYYIEYPAAGGSWIAQVSTVGAKNIICSKTKLSENWQNLSASKEGAMEMNGPVYYCLTDSSELTTLTDPANSFEGASGEESDKKIKEVKETDEKDYSSLIMCGLFIAVAIAGFVTFKVKSDKKAKAEEAKAKKEKELAEYKESRKRTTKQIEEDLTKAFENEGEDWSDVQVEWDTKPTVLEMPEEKKESKAIKKRVNQIKEVNAEYTNTVIRDAQKAQSKKDEEERRKVPSYDESDSVILNPVIPNFPDSGNDDDLF